MMTMDQIWSGIASLQGQTLQTMTDNVSFRVEAVTPDAVRITRLDDETELLVTRHHVDEAYRLAQGLERLPGDTPNAQLLRGAIRYDMRYALALLAAVDAIEPTR